MCVLLNDCHASIRPLESVSSIVVSISTVNLEALARQYRALAIVVAWQRQWVLAVGYMFEKSPPHALTTRGMIRTARGRVHQRRQRGADDA